MSIAATTFIKNIRTYLSEPLGSDAELETAGAGTLWLNSELLENLNKSKNKLVDLVRKVREDYFETLDATLNLNSTTKSYDLATLFKQLKGIRISTSGYEGLRFRFLEQETDKWKELDALPSADDSADALYYDVVGTKKLLLANYPPATLTAKYNYIGGLADFTLSTLSTLDLEDDWREFLEGYAVWLSLAKSPTDQRLPFWKSHLGDLEQRVRDSVAKRQIRDAKRVQPFNPY